MNTSEKLRRLVKEATPGPWRYREGDSPGGPWGQVYTGDDPTRGVVATTYAPASDARLIALAPQLAELVAVMGEELTRLTDPHRDLGPADFFGANRALARLDALFSESAPDGHTSLTQSRALGEGNDPASGADALFSEEDE